MGLLVGMTAFVCSSNNITATETRNTGTMSSIGATIVNNTRFCLATGAFCGWLTLRAKGLLQSLWNDGLTPQMRENIKFVGLWGLSASIAGTTWYLSGPYMVRALKWLVDSFDLVNMPSYGLGPKATAT